MDRYVENEDQIALRRWLTAGLRIPEVVDLHGDAGYLLNNMIAKYTLAASAYAVSESAETLLLQQGVDFGRTYPRRAFYGKRDGRNPFIYEHAVPAGVLRAELLGAGGDEQRVSEILMEGGPVAVLLRTEDELLRAAGLGSRMPEGWRIGDDPLARYHAVGIRLGHRMLHVEGAICR
jgi:hypothetical protein